MQRQWLWGQTKDVKSMTERCEVRTRDARSRTADVRWRTPYRSSTTKELKPTTQDVSRTGHVQSTTMILPAGRGAAQCTLSTAAGVKVKCAQVASVALLLKFNQSISTCSVLRRCFCSPQTVYLSVNGMKTNSMNYIQNKASLFSPALVFLFTTHSLPVVSTGQKQSPWPISQTRLHWLWTVPKFSVLIRSPSLISFNSSRRVRKLESGCDICVIKKAWFSAFLHSCDICVTKKA